MVAVLRVLFDLNVILDVLLRREPFYAASARKNGINSWE